MGNSGWLWLPAAAAAGILQTAGGTPWPDTGLTALAAAALLCLPKPKTQPGWMGLARSVWNGLILAQVLRWCGGIWPQVPIWAAAGVLVLALWLSNQGKEAMMAAGSVLGLMQLILAGAVLLAALPEVRLENWSWGQPVGNGWLLTILLLPALAGAGFAPGPGLWALAVSLITTGVLGKNGGYYELSKSVSLFGSIKRLESLAAAGLTLGFLLLGGELLKSEKQGETVLTAAVTAVGFLTGWILPPAAAGIGSVAVWVIFPWIYGLLYGKRGK